MAAGRTLRTSTGPLLLFGALALCGQPAAARAGEPDGGSAALAVPAATSGAEPGGRAGAQPGSGAGEWHELSAAELADVRGGFETGSGLSIAFTVQRVVSVDGQVVSTLQVDVPGAGAGVASAAATGATVVQNALSNQDLRTATVIQAQVNSWSTLRELFQEWRIRQGIVSSVRP